MSAPPPDGSGLQDTPLFDLVFQRISESPDGSVPFSVWMDLALYAPGLGYYAREGGAGGFRAIGRGGDFFTSVSVGETFGLLLAHRIAAEWATALGRSRPFVVVEQGGHDGRLGRDIVAGLEEIGAPFLGDFEYRLVEPRPGLRARLEEALPNGGPIRVVPSLEAAAAPTGVFLCNELLDAFPVDLLVFEGGAWWERRVGWDDAAARPVWTLQPPQGGCAELVAELGLGFPEGYRTEVCPAVDEWMAETSGLFGRGLWWIVDYGHERGDYYRPDRREGTLRCYRDHRAGEDPFAFPGEQDLTAHVDFTRVELAARRAGLRKLRLTDQHRFLVEAARPWLLAMEGKAPDKVATKRLRQFQTLTHPSLMGLSFRVLELARP
jgi:SAM-dependent MidA family methyltransferase